LRFRGLKRHDRSLSSCSFAAAYRCLSHESNPNGNRGHPFGRGHPRLRRVGQSSSNRHDRRQRTGQALPVFLGTEGGSGRAALALHDHYREGLKKLHNQVGARYVRFHGVKSIGRNRDSCPMMESRRRVP